MKSIPKNLKKIRKNISYTFVIYFNNYIQNTIDVIMFLVSTFEDQLLKPTLIQTHLLFLYFFISV